MPTIDLGRIGIWTGALDGVATGAAVEAVQAVEAMGVPTVWIPEAVGRDPLIAATNYLANTSTLKLATGIANIYARDPMTMNSAVRTIEDAFPGRFLLGLGVSHAHLVAGVRKHDYSKPLAYMDVYLDRMDSARFFAVGPAERPPRVLAALGPKMLALAATKADGAHPYFQTPEHTAISREVMGADALLAPEQMCVLETDPLRAREIARKGMKIYLGLPNYWNNLLRLGFSEDDRANGGSDRLVDAVVVWGTVDQVKARVQAHHDAGADHVCVQVLRDDATLPMVEWRELAAALL